MNKKTQKKLLDIVKQNYEEIAEDFSRTRSYVWPELKKIIASVIARSPAPALWGGATKQSREDSHVAEPTGLPRPDSPAKTGESGLAMTVLDVGCGNGRMLDLFEEQDIEYVGIEQSKKLVEKARERCADRGGKCKITEGDILHLDKYVKGRFNLILCIAVLHHIPSKELRTQALKQVKKHLAPNGQCIITVWNLHTQEKYRKLIWKYAILKILGFNRMDFGDILFDWKNSKGGKVSQRYYHAFKKKELQKLLVELGIKLEKLYSDNRNIYTVCGLT